MNVIGVFYKPYLTYTSCTVDDLEVPVPSEEHDVVDMELFWDQVETSLISRGLVKGNNEIQLNRYF